MHRNLGRLHGLLVDKSGHRNSRATTEDNRDYQDLRSNHTILPNHHLMDRNCQILPQWFLPFQNKTWKSQVSQNRVTVPESVAGLVLGLDLELVEGSVDLELVEGSVDLSKAALSRHFGSSCSSCILYRHCNLPRGQ
jgi:hypothetical protein